MYTPKIWKKRVHRQAGVRDCAVIGIEREGNAEPCAVLLLEDPQANQAAVIENANRSLAEYQKIRHWFLLARSRFPTHANAKATAPAHSRSRQRKARSEAFLTGRR